MKLLLFALFFAAVAQRSPRLLTKQQYDYLQEQALPNGDWMLYLVFYIFGVLIFMYPPDALTSAGVTTENIFASYLGNRNQDVIMYNCKRVVLNRGLLSVYPFMFFMVLEFWIGSAVTFTFAPSRVLHYMADISMPLLLLGLTWIIFHHMTNYIYIHPRHFASTNLQELNQQISSEMLSVDTFRHRVNSSSDLTITRSWIIYSSKFCFQIIRLEEATFRVFKVEELVLNPLNPEGAVQIITLRIEIPRTCGKDIIVTMHNITLQDLINTVHVRVDVPPHFKFKMSTTDRFAKIFSDEAAKNPVFYVESEDELDPCLGCAEHKANMKLVRRCTDFEGEGSPEPCRDCRCRPMWCVQCMAKVFAAKQAQKPTAHWIAEKAPCPTCRSIFCIFDVALIKVRNNN